MAAVMLFLRQSTGKTERYTHFCMPLKPVFTRDCGDGVHFTDEPTGNLDEDTAVEITNILKECAHQMNKCVIIVTHSNELAKQADVILKLRKGELQIADTPDSDTRKGRKS